MGSHGLIFLALLPGILIIFYIYKMDKVEKEPWGLIFRLMIFGALSCIPASIFENLIDGVMPAYQPGSLQYALFMAFASAALCEEICKYAFLRFGSWRNPNFGYRFDGIVYGVSVAIGFAALENVLYVTMGGLEVALMRGVLAVPLHAFCGVFMGVFFGAAKKAQVEGRSTIKYKVAALIVPMMIHGIYDTLAFLGNSTATIILLAFVLVMYIVSIRLIRAYSRDDASSAFYPNIGPLSQEGVGHGSLEESYRRYAYGNHGDRTEAAHPHPGQVHDGKIILICPHCRQGLKVPAGAGRIRVKCPSCGGEFEDVT